MKDFIFELNKIRIEISFKSYEELRLLLSFYQKNNLHKINIPCKNNLKKDFLLNSIRIAKEEFPNIDIIPHFSIMHEFIRNRINTQNSFIEFMNSINLLGCNEVLLVSGSKKRHTLDSVSTLNFIKEHSFFSKHDLSIGVAFNPYLPSFLFEEEILRLEKKLQSGLVSSIWLQFGTDYKLLETRIFRLKNLIFSTLKENPRASEIILFGSILIPSKQFLARFKFRPWTGVYCSDEFLGSVDLAKNIVTELIKTYKLYEIYPIIETSIAKDRELNLLKNFFKA
tara:strand:+ start:3143 stop:3988 length:846 start_codon:yes stop_codon:yes gene_type:complete